MDEANIYHSKDIDSLLPSKEVQEKINKSMLLAQKIFKAIKAKGWNKSDFAEAMGVKNLSIISKWLSGTNNFETNTLFDIEKVLDIELVSLRESNIVYANRYFFTDKTASFIPTASSGKSEMKIDFTTTEYIVNPNKKAS